METLRENHQNPVFPLKLLMAYIVSISLIPTIQRFLDFDSIERSIEDINWDLGWSLVLCAPLILVIFIATRYFRRMPLFAGFVVILALWHIVSTLLG